MNGSIQTGSKPVSRPGFNPLYDIAPQILLTDAGETGRLQIVYGPAIDIRAVDVKGQGVEDVHQEAGNRFLAAHMLHHEHAALRFQHTAELAQPRYREGYRAEYTRTYDCIESGV
mgnify:CR=1 FL=1